MAQDYVKAVSIVTKSLKSWNAVKAVLNYELAGKIDFILIVTGTADREQELWLSKMNDEIYWPKKFDRHQVTLGICRQFRARYYLHSEFEEIKALTENLVLKDSVHGHGCFNPAHVLLT